MLNSHKCACLNPKNQNFLKESGLEGGDPGALPRAFPGKGSERTRERVGADGPERCPRAWVWGLGGGGGGGGVLPVSCPAAVPRGAQP